MDLLVLAGLGLGLGIGLWYSIGLDLDSFAWSLNVLAGLGLGLACAGLVTSLVSGALEYTVPLIASDRLVASLHWSGQWQCAAGGG